MRRRPEGPPAARPMMVAQVLEYEELTAWLRLTTTPKLGGAGLRRLLSAFGMPEQVMRESEASLVRCVGEELAQSLRAPATADSEWLVDYTSLWLEEPGHYVVTLADPAYPASLLASPDPPAVLYVCGRLELLHPGPRGEPAVAIVGSRRASNVGRANAGLFARELGAAGVTIVSGLADGIDAAAHWGALDTVGGTVAIVGTGADRVYPEVNFPLAEAIAGAGVMVSEWPLCTRPRAANFPRRNRLIAALGVGVLVVEAAPYSGSLITARLAADCGRDVYAIPGSIQSLSARGCNRLIREGAMLVETPADILASLGMAVPPAETDPEPGKRKGRVKDAGTVRRAKTGNGEGSDSGARDTGTGIGGTENAVIESTGAGSTGTGRTGTGRTGTGRTGTGRTGTGRTGTGRTGTGSTGTGSTGTGSTGTGSTGTGSAGTGGTCLGAGGSEGKDADEGQGANFNHRGEPGQRLDPDTPEAQVLGELGHDPAPIDVLVARTGLPGATVQAAVLALELDGRIEWLPGGRIVSTGVR